MLSAILYSMALIRTDPDSGLYILYRICAVYGGIYMLDHSVRYILIDENTKKFNSLIDDNDQQLSSTLLISSIDYVPISIVEAVEDTWYYHSLAFIYLFTYL